MHQRRLDTILDTGHLGDIGAEPDDDLRSMKAECTEVENELPYVRRLTQARIDILDDEQHRRASGGPVEDVVATLRRVLSRGESRTADSTRASSTWMRGTPAF